MEQQFGTKDVSRKTRIGNNLIREYSRALEQNGYTFTKSGNGQRLYTLNDIRLLQQINKEQQDSLEELNEIISSLLKNRQVVPVISTLTNDVTTTMQEQTKTFEEFMGKIHHLTDQNEKIITLNYQLLQQNTEQEKKIEHIFETMEQQIQKRDEQVMRVIRDLQETKKMTAAANAPKERKWITSIKSLFVKLP